MFEKLSCMLYRHHLFFICVKFKSSSVCVYKSVVLITAVRKPVFVTVWLISRGRHVTDGANKSAAASEEAAQQPQVCVYIV